MPLDHSYALPPSELLAIMLDLDYLKARHERFNGVGTPEVERSDTEAVITTVRQLPMDKVPGAFKGFVGDGQIVQVDTWQLPNESTASEVTGEWRADLGSAPAKMGGTHIVQSTDGGSDYSVTVDVSIKVPFVGGKMEGQVRGYLEHLIGKEQEFLEEWVAKK
jgi:Protein of unknown function (DUF2505)